MDELKRYIHLSLSVFPLLINLLLLNFNYRGIVRRNSFWDYLIFNKVQKSLGGRVRFILTGSAPISNKVLNFLRCAFGCMVSTHTHTHTHMSMYILPDIHKHTSLGEQFLDPCWSV